MKIIICKNHFTIINKNKLHTAIVDGNVEQVEKILKQYPNTILLDLEYLKKDVRVRKNSPIQIAMENRKYDIIEVLVKHGHSYGAGTDKYTKYIETRSPYFLALQLSYNRILSREEVKKIYKILLKYGVNVDFDIDECVENKMFCGCCKDVDYTKIKYKVINNESKVIIADEETKTKIDNNNMTDLINAIIKEQKKCNTIINLRIKL